jgi:hypothetical protein
MPGGLMSERTDRRRGTASMRVTLTSLLVASGIGVVGVVPALAENKAPVPAAFAADHDRGDDRGHERWFRNRGDVRYVWFRVCEGTTAGATPATTTTTTTTTEPTTETVAPDAVAAAVEGAAADTATTTDTSTTTDTVPTDTTTTDTTPADATPTDTTPAEEDDPDAEAYPTFVVVPLPKDEAKTFRNRKERPCYDLTTGAPRTTTPTTTTDTTTTDTPPVVETTTTTPVDTVTG